MVSIGAALRPLATDLGEQSLGTAASNSLGARGGTLRQRNAFVVVAAGKAGAAREGRVLALAAALLGLLVVRRTEVGIIPLLAHLHPVIGVIAGLPLVASIGRAFGIELVLEGPVPARLVLVVVPSLLPSPAVVAHVVSGVLVLVLVVLLVVLFESAGAEGAEDAADTVAAAIGREPAATGGTGTSSRLRLPLGRCPARAEGRREGPAGVGDRHVLS